jgi:hypothetical protein
MVDLTKAKGHNNVTLVEATISNASTSDALRKGFMANIPSESGCSLLHLAFKAPKRRLNDEGEPWCYAPAKNGGLCLVASRRRAESRGRGALATEKKGISAIWNFQIRAWIFEG